MATATASLSKAPRFVFTEAGDAWTQLSTTGMPPADLAAAKSAWKEADGVEFADDEGEEHHKDEDAAAKDGRGRPEAALSEPAASGGGRLCHSPPADAPDRAAGGEDGDQSISVRKKMDQHMRVSLKWSHPELHDALLVAGLAVPG